MNSLNRVRISQLSLALAVALSATPVLAQNTSSAIGGQITGVEGKPLAGATVTIKHIESGSVSTAVTDANGRYSSRGLRVGGPYTITISKDGLTETKNNVYLQLAETKSIDAALSSQKVLDTVTVTGVAGGSDVFSATKMGAGTTVGLQTLESLPSMGGNIQDYMRLDPRVTFVDRASGSMSAGGQNPRFNAIRVDGVSASDTFGLEGNNMPTRRQPVAMDALEALSIDLASYDVTITGATGAVVDAVTKSGTNEFHGSVYGYYRDGDWFGEDPTGKDFNGFTDEQTFGVTFGGPLIKDKLFFFLNYEKYNQSAPGADIAGSALGKPNAVIDMDDITRAQDIAESYGIDAGGLESTADTDLEEYAAKIDWNINDDHRFSFRYSNLEQNKLRVNGINSSSISLSSYWYEHVKSVESYVGSLFSNWSDTFSTEVKVSYRDYSAVRETPTSAPSVRIYFGGTEASPSGDSIFLGTEVNSHQNSLYTETWNAFASGTLKVGDHDIKFGGDFSTNDVYNIYGPQLFGVYEFYGLDNFESGKWTSYNLRTPQPGLGFDSVAGVFKYESLGVFVQDTWYVNSQLTLNYGFRADKPDVNKLPVYNAGAEAAFGYDNSQVLNEDWLFQPRAGFNYTFETERPTQVRGGVGLFRGESPQVWLSNAYNTTGFNYIQYSQTLTSPENWEDLEFNGDGYSQPVPTNPTAALQNVNFVSPDFEQPSVWKANIAVDHELPYYGLVASAELLVSQVETALFYQNLNLGAPTSILAQDGRDLFWNPTNAGKSWSSSNNRYNRNRSYDTVYLLDNTGKGESTQFTLSLNKPWSTESDWSWYIAYTYTDATEVSGLTSSTASSGWNYNYLYNANEEVAATSRYEISDRFSGNLNWEHAFFGDYKTRVGLVYEGRSGRRYSWVYSNDVNGDGRSANDLFYVPSGPGDVLFGTLSSNGVFTANAAMETSFFDWLGKNPDLAKLQGSVTDANAGQASWVNTFDLRLTQELPGFFKGHKSEIWLDVQNIGNLINSDWGHIMDYGFFATQRVLSSPGIYNGKYVYNFTNPDAPTAANGDADGFNTGVSQWSLQLGFRYKF